MFCVYYVIWTESLGVSGRAGANHNAQWHPEFLFFSECCLCISANLILYFMYVNQKLSCKMGSNKVFLNLNLNLKYTSSSEIKPEVKNECVIKHARTYCNGKPPP